MDGRCDVNVFNACIVSPPSDDTVIKKEKKKGGFSLVLDLGRGAGRQDI